MGWKEVRAVVDVADREPQSCSPTLRANTSVGVDLGDWLSCVRARSTGRKGRYSLVGYHGRGVGDSDHATSCPCIKHDTKDFM